MANRVQTVNSITEAEYDYSQSTLSLSTDATIAVSDTMKNLGIVDSTSDEYDEFWQNRLYGIRFGNGIKKINEYAGVSCNLLSSVIIPSNCLSIGNNAFANCIRLSKLYIEPKMTDTIGDRAFYNTGFTDLNVSLYVNGKIGSHIFSNCNNLSTAHLKINKLGKGILADCSKLVSVTFENLNTQDINWLDESSYEIGYNTIMQTEAGILSNCVNLKEVNIPPYLTNIPDYAFAYNLTANLDNTTKLSINFLDDNFYLGNEDVETISQITPSFGAGFLSGRIDCDYLELPERFNFPLRSMFGNSTFTNCNWNINVKFNGINSSSLMSQLAVNHLLPYKEYNKVPLFYGNFQDIENGEGILPNDNENQPYKSDIIKLTNCGYDHGYKFKCGRFYAEDCFTELLDQAFEKRLPLILLFAADKNAESESIIHSVLKDETLNEYMVDGKHPFYWCIAFNNVQASTSGNDGLDFYPITSKDQTSNPNPAINKTITLDENSYPWAQYTTKKRVQGYFKQIANSKKWEKMVEDLPTRNHVCGTFSTTKSGLKNIPSNYYAFISSNDDGSGGEWRKILASDKAIGKLLDDGVFSGYLRSKTSSTGDFGMINGQVIELGSNTYEKYACTHSDVVGKFNKLNIDRIKFNSTKDVVAYIFWNAAPINSETKFTDIKAATCDDIFADSSDLTYHPEMRKDYLNRNKTCFSTNSAKALSEHLDTVIKDFGFDYKKYYETNLSSWNDWNNSDIENISALTVEDKMTIGLCNKNPKQIKSTQMQELPKAWFGFNIVGWNNTRDGQNRPRFTSSDNKTFYFNFNTDLSASNWSVS